jgi:hypothetical protein
VLAGPISSAIVCAKNVYLSSLYLSETMVFLSIDSISGLKWKEFGKIHTSFGRC